jgi:YgiT-type zinc finger domain-containing protein
MQRIVIDTNECLVCGSKHFTEQKVNKIYEVDGNPVLVRDLPAFVCNNCGEKYFSGSTHDKIMKIVYNEELIPEEVKAKSYQFV